MWVYLGHLADAAGYSNALLARHALAVDLFMVLSGFLMVHSWKGSDRGIRPWDKASLRFYIARFMRISPPYFVLLLACYPMLGDLASMHNAALRAIPPPWAALIENYVPNSAWNFDNARWFWLHVSFLFGLVPGMENSTPLPDWSLSLEMQFYFVFPVLLAVTRHIPLIFLGLFGAVLALISPGLFGNYLDAGTLSHFGQPSFLPYRLNTFLAGMVIAIWMQRKASNTLTRNASLHLICTGAICLLPMSRTVIVIYAVFVALALGKLPKITRILNLKPLRFLGDISYSIYLAHILIIIPVMYLLTTHPAFLQLSPHLRFAAALVLTFPLVVGVSYFLFRWVELPSIRAGISINKYILGN